MMDLSKTQFLKGPGGRYQPYIRQRKSIWIGPTTGVAYYETGEDGDVEWLKENGFVKRVAWVLVPIRSDGSIMEGKSLVMKYQFNEDQKRWLEALRSGEYKQTCGVLYDGEGYCCLGVASKLIHGDPKKTEWADFTSYAWLDSEGTASDEVVERLRLRDDEGIFEISKDGEPATSTLATMNDNGATFKQIADFIEQNPEKVFVD